MERKLVTIRTISNIKPIEGADNIELAFVDGWQVVVKKGEFSIGDYAFYFEIDSFLPTDRPEFAFLKPSNGKVTVYNGVEGHRLRTIRLRKQLSQGLLVPINPEANIAETFNPTAERQDYSAAFGVQKWERPIPAQLIGTVRSTFPTHIIPKTDQERVRNIIGDLKERILQNPEEAYEVTIKLDGSSMTVYKYGDDIGVLYKTNVISSSDAEEILGPEWEEYLDGR